MAEIVGFASAIAGLLTFTAEITKLSYNLITDIRAAPRTQKLYLQETSALADVMLRAEQAASEAEALALTSPRPTSISSKILDDIKNELDSILQDLKGGTSRAKWLLKDKDLRRRIDQLQNFRCIFADYIASTTLIATKAVYSKVEKMNVEGRRERLLDWLREGENASRSLPVAVSGTGEHFLKCAKYKDWTTVEWDEDLNREMWCYGAPGSGKSMLASIVARDLMSNSNNSVAYYFCDFELRRQHTATRVLRSLLSQLLGSASDQVWTAILDLELKTTQEPSMDDLSELLQYLMNPQTFVILDAPDEMEIASFGLIMSTLRQDVPIRTLVTSRDMPEIRSKFSEAFTYEVSATSHDVRLFVENRFQDLELYFSKQKVANVTDAIVERANGIFLLARILVDEIVGATTMREIKEFLADVPSTLAAAYDSGIRRIDSQPMARRQMAREAIAWITYAQRKFTAQELTHALAIKGMTDEFDEDDIADIRLVLQICCGFVVMQDDTNQIGLVHSTAHEYFRKHMPLDTHATIAKACITYLSSAPFHSAPCRTHEEMCTRTKQRPFMFYAAKHWRGHIAEGKCESELFDTINGLLEDRNIRLNAFQTAQYRQNVQAIEVANDILTSIPTEQSALHVAAFWDLDSVTKALLQGGAEVSARDSQDWTPLHWACSNSSFVAVRHLISFGADLEAKDSEGWTPLVWLAYRGNLEGVRLLLSHGANHLISTKSGWGVLSWAFAAQREEVVQCLCEHHRTILSQSRETHEKPAGMLETSSTALLNSTAMYDHGLYDILSEDKKGSIRLWSNEMFDMPVSSAWRTSNKESSPVWYDLRFDRYSSSMTSPGTSGSIWKSSLLHGAIKSGSFTAFRALLEIGVDVDCDLRGRTPLHVAAYRKDPRFVELLIARGADVSSLDEFGRTPLHLAIALGFEATASVLLGAGSDPNARAHQMQHSDSRRFEDLMAQNGFARRSETTPLVIACGLGREYKLLEEGSERPGRPRYEGQDFGDLSSPEAALLSAGMVSLLLRHNAKVNAKDENDCAALHWAVMFGASMEVIKALVKAGADVKAANKKGKTPIDLALVSGRQETFEYLTSVAKEGSDKVRNSGTKSSARAIPLNEDNLRQIAG